MLLVFITPALFTPAQNLLKSEAVYLNYDAIWYFLNPSLILISVQERLTKEVANAVLEAIAPTGVGVIVEAW